MNKRKTNRTYGNGGKEKWTTLCVLMEYRNMSINDLSKASGIPLNTLARWVRSKPDVIGKLEKLSNALGVPLSMVLSDDLFKGRK